MTLKKFYEQTDRSKINQLKCYEFGEENHTEEVEGNLYGYSKYFNYLVIGIEPYIDVEPVGSSRLKNDSAFKAVAKLRIVIVNPKFAE